MCHTKNHFKIEMIHMKIHMILAKVNVVSGFWGRTLGWFTQLIQPKLFYDSSRHCKQPADKKHEKNRRNLNENRTTFQVS